MQVADPGDRPALWLGIGGVLALFSVHGRWDVAAAAWLFSIFLLRYARCSRPLRGLLVISLVQVVAGMFWLYQAGNLWNPIAVGVVALISVVLTLPFLADRLVPADIHRHHPVLASLVFPAARVAAEFAITRLSPAGAIYGSLGTTQHDNGTLIQISSVFGAYAISFVLAWLAPVANLIWTRSLSSRSAVYALVAYLLVLAAVVSFGAIRLRAVSFDGDVVQVAGISPTAADVKGWTRQLTDLPELRDFSTAPPQRMREVFARVNAYMLASTEREARNGAKIITWSESAGQTMERDKDTLVRSASALARRYGIYINLAMSVYTDEAPFLRNQTVLVTPDGSVGWTYDKAHPVPGLEPMIPGDGIVPIESTPYGVLSNLICYDIDFPDLARSAGASGADIVLVPANNWAGIKQLHAEKARFRAVEGGYSLVHQASKGIAEITDPLGRVLARSDYFTTDQQVVRALVPTTTLHTIYSRVGDVFAGLCTAFTLAALATAAARRRRSEPSHPHDIIQR